MKFSNCDRYKRFGLTQIIIRIYFQKARDIFLISVFYGIFAHFMILVGVGQIEAVLFFFPDTIFPYFLIKRIHYGC